MAWIEASKYALTALAAVLGCWVVARIRRQGPAPSEAGERLLHRFMSFCIALLLLSGVLALFEVFFLQKPRQNEMRQIIGKMDLALGSKFDIEGDAFEQVDSHTKHQLDNMVRQLCRDLIEMNKTAAASAAAANCKTRLERPALAER
jgi:hypothetical protein